MGTTHVQGPLWGNGAQDYADISGYGRSWDDVVGRCGGGSSTGRKRNGSACHYRVAHCVPE